MVKQMVQVLCTLALVFALAGAVAAQGQQPPPTFEQVTLRQWNAVHKKVIDMAKDFPEDKWDSRPHKDARSFIEEVWHVTATAEWLLAQYTGQQVDTDKLFNSYDGRPRNRAELVAQLEKASGECAKQIEQKPNARVIGLIEHAAEHYGKMATIYRMNGVVPPTSRSQND